MTDRSIIVHEHFDLGVIKIIDSDTRFPWEFFCNGEINCAFRLSNPTNINDIRVWINKHIEEPAYIERSRWGDRSYKIAFTSQEDASRFVLKFGDLIKNYD